MNFWSLILIGLILLSPFSNASCATNYTFALLGGFSPDEQSLALAYCTDSTSCKFGVFSMETRKFSSIPNRGNKLVAGIGSYSPDGKALAVDIKKSSLKEDASQIAIYDLASGDIKEVTESNTFKSSPEFSPDGKKIIFAQSNRRRESGKTKYSRWDIYEVQVDGSGLRRLTNCGFFQIAAPHYFGSPDKFIFSGNYPGHEECWVGPRKMWSYRDKFGEDRIFVFSVLGKNELVPYLTNDGYSTQPAVSQDGSLIIYVARTDKIDGIKSRFTYDLYALKDSKRRRLSKFNGIVTDLSVSPSGRFVSAVYQPHDNLEKREIVIIDMLQNEMVSIDPEGGK